MRILLPDSIMPLQDEIIDDDEYYDMIGATEHSPVHPSLPIPKVLGKAARQQFPECSEQGTLLPQSQSQKFHLPPKVHQHAPKCARSACFCRLGNCCFICFTPSLMRGTFLFQSCFGLTLVSKSPLCMGEE